MSESVKVEGPRLTADVRNTANANGTFTLALTAYGDTLRLFVDEHPAKGRFQVPDVLVPGLEARQQVRAAGRGLGQVGGVVRAWHPSPLAASRVIPTSPPKLPAQNWELVKKSYTKARLRLPPAGASPGADVELRFAPAALEVSCCDGWWRRPCCCRSVDDTALCGQPYDAVGVR